MNVIFISGPPSVGKTRFLRYAESRGAKTISLVKENKADWGLDDHGKRAEWDAFLRGDDEFIRWLRGFRTPCIMEWGYPADCLPIVGRLKAHGIPIWWLDGDEAVARALHGQAGKSLEEFDRQIEGIKRTERDWRQLYGHNVIQRLRSDGTFESNETIFNGFFSVSPEQMAKLERLTSQTIEKVAVPLLAINSATDQRNYASGTAMATTPPTILTCKHVSELLKDPDWDLYTWLEGCDCGVGLRRHSEHPTLDLATLRVAELIEMPSGCWTNQTVYRPQELRHPIEDVCAITIGFPKEYRSSDPGKGQENAGSIMLALPIASVGDHVINLRMTNGKWETQPQSPQLYGLSGSPIMQEALGPDGKPTFFLVGVIKGGASEDYIAGHVPVGLKADGTW